MQNFDTVIFGDLKEDPVAHETKITSELPIKIAPVVPLPSGIHEVTESLQRASFVNTGEPKIQVLNSNDNLNEAELSRFQEQYQSVDAAA